MDIYCKNECSRPKNTQVVGASEAVPHIMITTTTGVFAVYDKPPPRSLENNKAQWVLVNQPLSYYENYAKYYSGNTWWDLSQSKLAWDPYEYQMDWIIIKVA
jgi:hypothetical protein